jgi:hypothetical protein
MRYLTALCVFALVFAVAAPAMAETQNVKVSGKIIERYIVQTDYDLDTDDIETAVSTQDEASFFMNTAWVQVDADLTDNVSATIRMLNQRNWDDPAQTGSRQAGNETEAYDVGVPIAYITLKEMLYSPLTLRIGRQPLWFGKGFIIGAKLRDPQGSISADEYTEYRNFDAIRATLDYDPWTIDAIYSKIEENVVNAGDDIDLYGINVGYLFDSYNAEAEGYYFMKNDKTDQLPGAGVSNRADSVHTLGIRGSFDPVENLTVCGEFAGQLGKLVQYLPDAAGNPNAIVLTRTREAYAADLSAEYRFVDVAWTPVIMGEWIYYSGNEFEANGDLATGDWSGWDPMYRGKFDTAIREFQGWLYLNNQFALGQDASFTNQQQWALSGSVKPTDTLTLSGKYTYFRLDEPIAAAPRDSKDIGDEIDLMLTYDYTEDVQFSVLSAWFMPGDLYSNEISDTASEVVASVSVDF